MSLVSVTINDANVMPMTYTFDNVTFMGTPDGVLIYACCDPKRLAFFEAVLRADDEKLALLALYLGGDDQP